MHENQRNILIYHLFMQLSDKGLLLSQVKGELSRRNKVRS
jgi:phosphoribosyl-ATP pyrophosphohydrolase